MFVYLAGPVDMVDGDVARGWRDVATQELMEARTDVAVFSPPRAITLGSNAAASVAVAETIIQINQVALARADFVIANLTGPSFGTPIECIDAACPVVGFGDLNRMWGSIYQHCFADLAHDLEQAVRKTLSLAELEEL